MRCGIDSPAEVDAKITAQVVAGDDAVRAEFKAVDDVRDGLLKLAGNMNKSRCCTGVQSSLPGDTCNSYYHQWLDVCEHLYDVFFFLEAQELINTSVNRSKINFEETFCIRLLCLKPV